MAKFRVWDPDVESETEVIVEAGKWSEYEADNTDSAASDYADYMWESGDFPDHFNGPSFELHVRNIDTSVLHAVTINYDWEPVPYVAKARELTGEEDELTHSVAKSYGWTS